MAFDALTLSHVEDALSEAFGYHNKLDSFLVRSGLSPAELAAARKIAEDRCAAAGRFSKAPKRFVVQAAMDRLAAAGDAGDRIIATMITSLTQMSIDDTNDAARTAIGALRGKIKTDRDVKAERRAEAERAARNSDLADQRARAEARATRTATRDALRDRFIGLISETDVQRRGYLFETFLGDLFDFEGLAAKRSFKLTGEQIGDPLLYIESIPYWETRGYVTTVMRNYWMYEGKDGRLTSPSREALAQGKWPKFPGAK